MDTPPSAGRITHHPPVHIRYPMSRAVSHDQSSPQIGETGGEGGGGGGGMKAGGLDSLRVERKKKKGHYRQVSTLTVLLQ